MSQALLLLHKHTHTGMFKRSHLFVFQITCGVDDPFRATLFQCFVSLKLCQPPLSQSIYHQKEKVEILLISPLRSISSPHFWHLRTTLF